MKTKGLPGVLLLSLCVACTHARTTASPRQEERAAQKAEGGGDGRDGSDSSDKDEKSDESSAKADEAGSASDGKPARQEGGTKADARKDDATPKGDEKDEDHVAPEDIEVATSPQGLLEPGALDKVRDKLGVAKGESVQGPLRRFQREHDLPATGMLDHETVERLGLSPDEIFERKADAR